MATSEGGVDIEAVLDQIKEDLSDNKLDQTGGNLATALDDFIGDTEHNKTGVTPGDDTAVAAAIDNSTSTGFEPTGDLAEVKTMLMNIIDDVDAYEGNDEKQGIADQYDDFVSYMDSFVPPSPEAHLFKAMGMLASIYSSDALGFIKQDDDGLGITYMTDFDAIVDGDFDAWVDDLRQDIVDLAISVEGDIIIHVLFCDEAPARSCLNR